MEYHSIHQVIMKAFQRCFDPEAMKIDFLLLSKKWQKFPFSGAKIHLLFPLRQVKMYRPKEPIHKV